MTDRIGKYKVERELGSGGFGKVYLAFDPDIGQQVAIKKLHAGGDPDLLRRFQAEIRTTASLRHKNVVTIHSSGEDAGDPYLVMEFLEGCTLKQVIRERRDLSILDKVEIMTQVAEGLAYAHSKGVVHRDVKPENIMLLPDDTVKIMDFGIALGPERNTNVTQTGGIIGTPPYFAPEQLEGSKGNEQTDIFSYGDLYYELLTGVHPFEQQKGDWRLLQIAILSYEPRPVGELLPACPDALETLVLRTLAKQPEFRYQKFDDVRLDNEAILVDLRHESAAAILREIPSLMESGQFQSALGKIRRAYQLEPGNREIRRLREEINLRIQGEQRQKQIAELMANAEKQISEGRYAEAVHSLELGYKLDSKNSVLADKLGDAKVRRDNYANANRLLSEARFKQQKGFLTEAQLKVQEALSIDANNTDAKRLGQQITDELKRRRLDEAVRRAQDHRAARRFADALAVLEEIEKELPGMPLINEVRAEIRNEQEEENRRIRTERFNLELTKCRDCMDSGDLDRAGQILNHLSAHFAAEPGATEILPAIRERLDHLVRAREISQYQHAVSALLQEKSFDKGLALIAEALEKFPGDSGLERLKKSGEALYLAHQRSEAVAAALREAAAKRDAGDLPAALESIRNAQRQLGDEGALLDLARSIEREIEQQRYSAGLDSLLKAGHALLAAGKYTEAVARLSAAQEFAGEAEVKALLESARAEAAIEDERRFVEDALTAAGKLQSEESWTDALSVVAQGLARYPQNSRLLRTAARLRDAIEQEQKRALMESYRVTIRSEIAAGRWNLALAAVVKARAEFPGEATFQDLSDQVDACLYEEGWRRFEALVDRDLADNAISEAERHLEQAAEQGVYAKDARWNALADRVAQRRAYEDALAEAERQRNSGALFEAEELLTRVISHGAPDLRATHLRGAIQSERSEAARQQEIARIAQGIRDRLDNDEQLALADLELAAARSRFPGESTWVQLQAQIDARKQSLRRKAELAAAEEGVRQSLRSQDVPQAMARLKVARLKFPEESIWGDLAGQIEALRATLQRQSDIAGVADNVRRWLGNDHTHREGRAVAPGDARGLMQTRRDDLGRATAELGKARQKYPSEALWNTLQSEIDGRRGLLDAERGILDGVERSLEAGEFEQAERQLARARKDFADEAFWEVVRSGITQGREFEKRRVEAARQAALERSAEIADIARRFRGQLDTLAGQPRTAPYPMAAIWEVLQNVRAGVDQADAKYPGEPVWEALRGEITERGLSIQREMNDALRDCPDLATLDANARQLAAAEARFPKESFWASLAVRIQERREVLTRQKDLDDVDRSVREHLERVRRIASETDGTKPVERQWTALQNAAAVIEASIVRYPGEPRLAVLQSETASHRAQWEREIAQRVTEIIHGNPIRGFSAGAIASEIPFLVAREPGHPLWRKLEAEIEATEARLSRQAEIAATGKRIYETLQREDIPLALADLNAARGKYPGEPLWATLQLEIDTAQARQQQRLLEARDLVRSRLLEIEAQLHAGASKRQIKLLNREALEAAASHSEDPEIGAIAGRIQQRVAALAAIPAPKTATWKLATIAGGGAVAAIGVALIWFHPRPPVPPKAPAIALLTMEVHSDPPGASVRVGDRSCVTPNCRLELAPGTYEVIAQLKDYESKQQTVRLDANRTVDVTLNPVPPAALPVAAAVGTLLVKTGVNDALVYIDNVPQRNRTDQSGSAMFSLEAKPHEVRVERNGYQKVAPKQVKITSGTPQTLAFSLLPENAKIEIVGAVANVELRVDGRPFGRTDGSATYLYASPVTPGSHTVEVAQGRLQTSVNSGVRSLTQKFEPGQTVRLIWKPDAPPVANPAPATGGGPLPPVGAGTNSGRAPISTPTPVTRAPSPEEMEDREWDKVRGTSDPAQLRDFRRKYANGRHARDADAALDSLAWSNAKKDSIDSLRAYVQEFPSGAHAAEANAQIGDLMWRTVDQNNLDQLRRFLEENRNSPRAREAQRKLDQLTTTENLLRKQVVDALSKLNVELNRKPLKDANVREIWPKPSRLFLDSLRQPGQEITLIPVEDAKVQGDVATILCDMTSTQGRVRKQTATVIFHYGGGRWLVYDLKVTQ